MLALLIKQEKEKKVVGRDTSQQPAPQLMAGSTHILYKAPFSVTLEALGTSGIRM